MSLDFPDNEEIPRRLMTNINYMRDEITSKLSEVKHKEKEFEEREKFFNNKFEGLSDEHKELFKNLEREFVKLNKSGVTTSQQLKENCSLANLQPDEVSLDLFKEMLQREEENKLIKSDQILNLKCLNFEEVINEMSNELHSLSKSKQNKNTTQENCVPNIDDIVDLHEIEMINNKEELLTDDLPSNSNSPNRKKINKKYGNITFEDLPTNKTFYMIKSKRAAESLKSSIEIDITDLGGARCCRKLQHNYDLNIQLTHSRSHSQQMISKKSYAVLKSTLNQQEAQTAKHEEVPKSKQIEATRVECKSQASLLPRNDNDSNGSSKRRKNKKLNSLIINGSIGKECRDDVKTLNNLNRTEKEWVTKYQG